MGKAALNFLIAFVLSIILMHLVLAAQLESRLHPVTILMALPLTLPFAPLSLIVFGQSPSIHTEIGLPALRGGKGERDPADQPHDRAVIVGGQALSPLLALVATPVFYSLFDDLSTRVTPRLWLARLFGRAPVPALSITGGSDA